MADYMTPIKRTAYLLRLLMQEGRVSTDWLITTIELIIRSDQGDVARERQAQEEAEDGRPIHGRSLRLAEQLLGDEVHLFQRPLAPHYLAEERCRLERREAAFLTQRGWKNDGPPAPHDRMTWGKDGHARYTAADAMKLEQEVDRG